MSLTELSDDQRRQAFARFQLLQPYLEGRVTLKSLVEAHRLSRRTAQRWVKQYRDEGLAGLVRRPRSDRGQLMIFVTVFGVKCHFRG